MLDVHLICCAHVPLRTHVQRPAHDCPAIEHVASANEDGPHDEDHQCRPTEAEPFHHGRKVGKPVAVTEGRNKHLVDLVIAFEREPDEESATEPAEHIGHRYGCYEIVVVGPREFVHDPHHRTSLEGRLAHEFRQLVDPPHLVDGRQRDCALQGQWRPVCAIRRQASDEAETEHKYPQKKTGGQEGLVDLLQTLQSMKLFLICSRLLDLDLRILSLVQAPDEAKLFVHVTLVASCFG
mmetsp:Transcript_60235/g.168153  ORF Transcript_60235/g.168153 Transcript_60235/m.168153 type:complete len:237 (+) Transcript_60235:548-1258(+)